MSSIEDNNSNNEKKCNLITFGNLDLAFILDLQQKDIDDYNINIQNLDDISFLEKNEELWSKIELLSNNESLNSFIQMNKYKKKKNFIEYIIFDDLKYKNINFDFTPILNTVLLSNGIIIKPIQLFKCEYNMKFQLKYNENKNDIILSGEKKNKEEEEEEENDENEENQENEDNGDMDDIGYLEPIYEEILNFEKFKYIYVDINEIISIKSEININQLYNFLLKLKNETKMEIIIFLSNINKIKKLFELMQIADIHIIGRKNILFEILKNKKLKEEEKYKKEKELLYKKLKTENNKNKNNSEESQENIYSARDNDLPKLKRIKTINSNFSLKPLNTYISKSLNKGNMYDYIRYILFTKNKNEYQNNNNKLGIYFDDFNKIFFVDYNKNNNQASINEYNFNLFPKFNIYKMKEIEEIRNILKENEIQCNSIIIGNIINEILINKEKINISNFYSITLSSSYSIKNILICKINKIEYPNNKLCLSIQINKNEIKDYIQKQESERKENGFNISAKKENLKSYKSIAYKPLRDKYLQSYMQSPTNIDILKSNDFINTKKKILTKRIPSSKTNIKKEEIKDSFINFMINRNINEVNQNYMKEFLNRKEESEYYIPGVNSLKEYYCYLGKRFRNKIFLPKIKNNNYNNNRYNKKMKNKSIDIIKKEFMNGAGNENKIDNLQQNNYSSGNVDSQDKTQEKRDVSKYKEIRFKETPAK